MPLSVNQIRESCNKYLLLRSKDHRYASFDYCYNYFNSFRNKRELSANQNMEKSCVMLAFYLASWGMFRGSSFLLERSATFFKPIIMYLSKECPASVWNIDVNNYSEQNKGELLKVYRHLTQFVPDESRHITLVTKIMLGVFGNVPAYDSYFSKTFKDHFEGKPAFTSFNSKSLDAIGNFYAENKEILELIRSSCLTFNFNTGKPEKIKYTRAKIIDMIGFANSLNE